MKVILMMFLSQSILRIQKSLRKDPGCIIDSVTDHTIIISKLKSLARSSYIKLLKELDHPRKGLINIQNNVLNGVELDK